MASRNNSNSIFSVSSSDVVDLVGDELQDFVDRHEKEGFVKRHSVTYVDFTPENIRSLITRFSASKDKKNPDLTKDEYSNLIEYFISRKPVRPVRVQSYRRRRGSNSVPSYPTAQPQPVKVEQSSNSLSPLLKTNSVQPNSKSEAQQMNQRPFTHSQQLRHERLMEHKALFIRLFGSNEEKAEEANASISQDSSQNQTKPPLPKSQHTEAQHEL